MKNNIRMRELSEHVSGFSHLICIPSWNLSIASLVLSLVAIFIPSGFLSAVQLHPTIPSTP